MSVARPHPLLGMLLSAAGGVFPPADGRAVFTPPLRDGLGAVVSFTGHAVLATELGAGDLDGLDLDGYGCALAPEVLRRLAGPRGVVGVIDVTLTTRGSGGGRLPDGLIWTGIHGSSTLGESATRYGSTAMSGVW